MLGLGCRSRLTPWKAGVDLRRPPLPEYASLLPAADESSTGASMTTEQRWPVSIEITPSNVTAFRAEGHSVPSFLRPTWLRGTLVLSQSARPGLIALKDRRVGHPSPHAMGASAADGVALGTTSFFSQYITISRRARPVRVRM